MFYLHHLGYAPEKGMTVVLRDDFYKQDAIDNAFKQAIVAQGWWPNDEAVLIEKARVGVGVWLVKRIRDGYHNTYPLMAFELKTNLGTAFCHALKKTYPNKSQVAILGGEGSQT